MRDAPRAGAAPARADGDHCHGGPRPDLESRRTAAYGLPRLGYFRNQSRSGGVVPRALGLLAAVVVQSVARDLPRGFALTAVAYGCGFAASVCT